MIEYCTVKRAETLDATSNGNNKDGDAVKRAKPATQEVSTSTLVTCVYQVSM